MNTDLKDIKVAKGGTDGFGWFELTFQLEGKGLGVAKAIMPGRPIESLVDDLRKMADFLEAQGKET